MYIYIMYIVDLCLYIRKQCHLPVTDVQHLVDRRHSRAAQASYKRRRPLVLGQGSLQGLEV